MIYKTNEEFYNDALSKGLIPLEEYKYINRDSFSKNKIKSKCSLCGKIFEITPHAVESKNGFGCRSCNRKKTHEQFINEMLNVDDSIEILEKYINSRTKIKCRCKKCNFEWERIPNDLLRGFGCPKCNNNIYYTPEQFKNEFYKVNNSIELLTDFNGHKTPILCKCKKDGYEWNAYPYDLINNRSGCRKCNGRVTTTIDEFIKRLNEINSDILVIGDYINNKTPIKLKCKICNHIWSARPDNLFNERCGCPECMRSKYKLEVFVKKYLDNNNILYKRDVRFDDLRGVGGKPLSYDFELIPKRILIECQGEQHYSPVKYFGGEEKFKIQKEHDKRKIEYAKNNNYKLIEINKKDLKNIDDILNDILIKD